MFKKSIPNFFTIGNLVCGFISIILIMNYEHNYIKYASFLIILAMLLDALDGRVARILHVENDFGKELDSLADLLTFGVAPALLTYNLFFQNIFIWGMVIITIFPICGALRLARFNSQVISNNGFFTGMPITLAGGILTALASFHNILNIPIASAYVILLSILMVSTILYPSFKKKTSLKYIVLLLPVLVTITIFIFKNPTTLPYMLLAFIFIYSIYGVKISLKKRKQKKFINRNM